MNNPGLRARIDELEKELSQTRALLAERYRAEMILNILLPIGLALSSEKNFDRLSENILSEALKLCHADGGTLYIRTKDDTLRFAIVRTHSLNFTLGGTSGNEIPFAALPIYDSMGNPNRHNVATRVALDGTSININDVYAESGKLDFTGTRAFDSATGYRTISMLTVPLKNNQGSVIGVLQLLNAQDPTSAEIIAFDAENQYVIEIMASLAAVALENYLLLQEQALTTGIKRDLEIGRTIQHTFLPHGLPVIPGWELDACFEPAREVAGDFYDAFMLPGNRLGLVIADVSDKGVAAALVMALVRSLIRAFAEQADITDPAKLDEHYLYAIRRTNNYLMDHHGGSFYFATTFFGVLNLETKQMAYINAGHNPPALINEHGVITARLMPCGPAVGMITGATFEIRQIALEIGDTLYCYTDGVTDARNPNGAFFSEKRLLALLGSPTDSVANLLTRIEATVKSHIGNAPQFDDITMLAIRRLES